MVLSFESAWSELQTVWVQPCVRTAGLVPPVEHKATTQELVAAYTLCYRMCTQRNPHNWSAALHKRFQEVLQWHVEERLLPGLLCSASSGRMLLMEVGCVWVQYKALVHEFQRPFHYLERYYVPANRLPSNARSGYHVFRSALLSPLIKQALQDALAAHASQWAQAKEGQEERTSIWAVLGPALECVHEAEAGDALGVSELVYGPMLADHPQHCPKPNKTNNTKTPSPPPSPQAAYDVPAFPLSCVSPSPRSSCPLLLEPMGASSSCGGMLPWEVHDIDQPLDKAPHPHHHHHLLEQQQERADSQDEHDAQALLPPYPSVTHVHADPQERLLKGFLPLAPSQGSLCGRFYCLKLRALCSPPVPPPSAPASVPLTPDPTSPRGPPTKLSRLGFASFSSSSSSSSSTSVPCASRVEVAGQGQWALAGLVLREVVTSLKDDLFVELMESLYAPVTHTTPFPLTRTPPLPSIQ